MASAASHIGIISILVTLFPHKIASIVATTELFFDFGFMFGNSESNIGNILLMLL